MPATMHPLFISPDNPRAKIWRYMDFTKYVALLETSSLYFCRSDKFADPFEGSTTKINYESWLEFEEKIVAPISKKHAGPPPNFFMEQRREIALFNRQRMYINCWHLNEYESEAMWKLYAQTNEAIAIKSTFKRLYECLPSFAHLTRDLDRSNNTWFGSNIYVGKVNYIDYQTDSLNKSNIFFPYLHKRKSFAHEQEIRAVYFGTQLFLKTHETKLDEFQINFSFPNQIYGVHIPIDLIQLIEQVYIAPTAPNWFLQLVKDITRRYGLNVPVQQSDLNGEPIFL